MISNEKLVDYYTKCESEGITEVNDAYSTKKAEQIANLLEIDLSDGIQQLFSSAKKYTLNMRNEEEIIRRNKEQKAALEKAQHDDLEDYKKLTLHSDIYGAKKILCKKVFKRVEENTGGRRLPV